MTQQALVAGEVVAATPQQPYVDEHSEPDTRLLSSIQIRGLLSFGPDSPALPLNNLNVIIGANGTGKSNLLDVIQLIGALPRDFEATLDATGGIENWLWKRKLPPDSNGHQPTQPAGQIDAIINRPYADRSSLRQQSKGLRYHLEFAADSSNRPLIREESLVDHEHAHGYFKRLQANHFEVQAPSSIRDRLLGRNKTTMRPYRREISSEQSLFYQMESSGDLPEIARLARLIGDIRVYQDWSLGRSTMLHRKQSANQRSDHLADNLSNMNLILSRLTVTPAFRDNVRKHLKDYAADADDFSIVTQSGMVELYFREGDISIPATRLSDGALRYLCLLLILCDPKPPPLICIEEPELGLHMDVLLPLAALIKKASTRTQLIVTTHSDVFLDCFSDQPESVITCRKIKGATAMNRLSQKQFDRYRRIASISESGPDRDLDEIGLAELWQHGFLGAVR